MTTKTHPAAVEVKGRMCLENERGGFDPLSQISPAEILEDELVRKLLAYAKPLSAELARFKTYSFADVEAFLGLLAQEYNVEKRTRKGNLTLYSYDRRLKVEIKSSDRIVFGPQLQMAKAKIDQCLLNWGASADPRLQTIVNSAFDVDREGNVRPARILLLRRAHITDDPEWADAMRAIDDAMRVVGTSFYMLFRQRVGDTDHWERISLDFANVEMTPDAEAAYSPRRELEQTQAQIGEIAAQLARLEPVCDTDGDILGAVKWAVDYVVGDLADLARGKKIDVDTSPTIDFLLRMDLSELSAELLLRHAKMLAAIALKATSTAAAKVDVEFISDLADALHVAVNDFDTALHAVGAE